MNTRPSSRRPLWLAIAAIGILGSGIALAAGGPPRIGPGTMPLSPTEIADLKFMREEEKVARDLYLALDERWGSLPFVNIVDSEESHMTAILQLLRTYRIADPVAGNLIGEFSDPELQSLYDSLLQRGAQSELEALRVGGFVEEADMLDLLTAMEHASHADIDQSYARLACGSRNHLRAFAATATALSGTAYTAQIMDQKAVDTILSSPHERCGGPAR